MRTYTINIDGDEQYRTQDRGQAKAFYNLVDETFERTVDGLKKQLIMLEENLWDGKVLLEDIIRCPQNKLSEELDEDMDEEQPIRRGFHR